MPINWSAIDNRSLLGKILRAPLGLIPKRSTLRIRRGPAKGMKWVVGSSNHGCWLGTYELSQREAIEKLIRPGMAAWDIGAHAGYYTLVLSRLVGPAGRVYAFEPCPGNLVNLLTHLRLNHVENARVLSVALNDSSGLSPFVIERTSSCSHLGNGERASVTVATRTMDHVVDEGVAEAPAFIKMDVEGAESRVLRGGVATLTRFKPILCISLHGPRQAEECRSQLTSLGYRLCTVSGSSWSGSATEEELLALP